MDKQTPFARISGSGSIKEGTRHFWHQRLTALANVPLTLFLVWLVTTIAGGDRAEMLSLIANPVVTTGLLLMVLSVTWHMRLGMQVVIEDYVHGEGAKFFLLISNNFFALTVAGLSVIAVLKLSFGS